MYQPRPRIVDSWFAPMPELGAGNDHLWRGSVLDRFQFTEGDDHHTPPVRILIVDDDSLVRETYASILTEEGYEVQCAESSESALKLIQQYSFDVMLCDMFMPDENGLILLAKVQVCVPLMPVIMVTGYGSVEMARSALQNGASDFITKPCKYDDLPIVVERNLTRSSLQRRNAIRYRQALQSSNETVLDALLTALNTRDTETEGHSERVTAYTIEMAERMGLDQAEMYHIERGALLHDIGKIGIPDRILLKPDKLTTAERAEMRLHPVIGYEMCMPVEALHGASQIVLYHHETWGGSGYPNGLKGENIPLGARIFAVADALDAMTSDRPYRLALGFEEARSEILRCNRTQFDPGVVDVFLSVPPARWQQLRALG